MRYAAILADNLRRNVLVECEGKVLHFKKIYVQCKTWQRDFPFFHQFLDISLIYDIGFLHCTFFAYVFASAFILENAIKLFNIFAFIFFKLSAAKKAAMPRVMANFERVLFVFKEKFKICCLRIRNSIYYSSGFMQCYGDCWKSAKSKTFVYL